MTKKRGGRPSSYNDSYAFRAQELAEFGATDAEIGLKLGISVDTIWRWQKQFPQFAEALKAGKAVFDERVEHSLAHRATGYSHREVKVFYDKDVGPVEHEVIKHYPPDTTAMIFWLKNRRPEKWRDVHRIEGEVNHKVTVDDSQLAIALLNVMTDGLRAQQEKVIEHDDSDAGTDGDGSGRPVRAIEGPDRGGDDTGEDVAAPAARPKRRRA